MKVDSYSENLAAAASTNIKEREYWLDKLSGELERLQFPYDNEKKVVRERIVRSFAFVFPEELQPRLMKLRNGADVRLYIIFVTALVILLGKYKGSSDIIVGTPIYKQDVDGELINTVLVLRSHLHENITFKELLLQLSRTVFEANENQNYPVKTLLYKLNIPFSRENDFPLFDIAVLLENIHDKDYLRHINYNMTFSFRRTGERMEGVLEYNSILYLEVTIERIIKHFTNLLRTALFDVNIQVSSIDLLSSEERKQLLYDFNNTEAQFSKDSTVHRLFEEQVRKTPGNTAVVYEDNCLTYRELNKRSNKLAKLLRLKGVRPDAIVGIMMEPMLEIILSILGILKAGGAYLPIDEMLPENRILFMLADCHVSILLTEKNISRQQFISNLQNRGSGLAVEIFLLNALDETLSEEKGENLTHINQPTDMVYIMFTSGTTGKPKGVIVGHRSVVNLLNWFGKTFHIQSGTRILQLTDYTFDPSVEDIFGALLYGATFYVGDYDLSMDVEKFIRSVKRYQVHLLDYIPTMLNQLICQGEKLNSLSTVISGGEPLEESIKNRIIERGYQLYNNYGPTETTVDALSGKCSPGKVTLGKPIFNMKAYIFDKDGLLAPVGITGELWISGMGIARGYVNNPGLTEEKFKDNPYVAGERMFKTGDLAKWLPDGNIEFGGRIDNQVKIRGFRIELGEIENRLLSHEKIKEAVIISKEDKSSDKYLCAYIVAEKEIGVSEIRDFLTKTLPDYMIPSYFVQLKQMPLTLNGKINRKALPEPEIKYTGEYIAPGNELEEKLADIWSDVLGIETDKISMDANFFELGGHSLKATVLVSKIHKKAGVKLSLQEIFYNSTIRRLARVIQQLEEDKYAAVETMEKQEYYPLSSAQQRLYVLQQMDPESTVYNMPYIILLDERIEIEKLEKTFGKLIARHGSLRTSFEMIDGEPVQKVHSQVKFTVEYQGLESPIPESQVTGIINNFIKPFSLSRTPLLRVGLVRLQHNSTAPGGHPSQEGKKDKYLLIVDMHHIISDGVSDQVLARDFNVLYIGSELSPMRLQYNDYSQWQNSKKSRKAIKPQEAFWLKEFAGEIPVLNIITDYPRPTVQSFAGSKVNFELSEKVTKAVNTLAQLNGATLFMVLLALYNVFLSKLSGQEDIVVGTPIAGRKHADLEQIIGMFVNTLALRNYPRGEKKFTGLLSQVKERALEAFENQDYQFEDLVEKVAVQRDTSRNPLFDVMFILQNIYAEPAQVIANAGEDTNTYAYDKKTSKFDLSLHAVERGEKMYFSFEYCTRLFRQETILRFIQYFKNIISSVVDNPGKKISEIEIISEEERKQLLVDFNNTGTGYPEDNTIHELFEEQVGRTPGCTALIGNYQWLTEEKPLGQTSNAFGEMYLTYRELNKKYERLAELLREKGVRPGTFVGIIMERSIGMIIGILGILKAGGAFLPIEPNYPGDRINYMLADSGARLLITTKNAANPENKDTIFLNGISVRFVSSEIKNQPATCILRSPTSLAYVIYTSGSTGRSKGAMVEHRSVVNLLFSLFHEYPFSKRDTYLFKTPYVFDVSISEVFGWFLGGGRLAILENGAEKDPEKISGVVERLLVTHINFVPSMFNAFVDSMNPQTIRQLSPLKYIFLAGEALSAVVVDKFIELDINHPILLENIYGPTEATVYTSKYSLSEWNGCKSIPIGKPLKNIRLYIVDKYNQLLPQGVPGELCIAGKGVSRGYLNRPELTAEKFKRAVISHSSLVIGSSSEISDHSSKRFTNDQWTMTNDRLYKTGDLTHWLPDGNIEFFGRIDNQVKIRGFRVEPGEIENQLLKHPEIREAAVVLKEDGNEDQLLCAYIVSDNKALVSTLREYLLKYLPQYLVPWHFVLLDRIPLTPSGKIDRKALPAIEPEAIGEYIAPQNQVEKKLVKIWSEVLGIDKDKISIVANFFRLGGHSLKATIMTAKVHKQLEVKLPLAMVFKTPYIRELSKSIKGLMREKYASIESTEKRDFYHLSSAQKRMYVLQQMENANIIYNMPHVLSLEDVHQEILLWAFKKLIARHETLRSSFESVDDEPVQKVHDDVEFKIEYYCTESKVQGLERKKGYHAPLAVSCANAIKNFIRPFELEKAPLLRVGLIKEEETKYILIIDMHHIITDGTSQILLAEEFMSLYAGKQLPPPRLQYKDYSQWQHSQKVKHIIKQQEEYWLKEFAGEIPVVDIPTDYKRPAVQSFEGGIVGFELSKETTKALALLARMEKATLFMVLLAIYNVFLSKLSGQEDIVVGTPIAGRKHADLEQIIGMFVNTLALRNYPREKKKFTRLLYQVKKSALEAFENQDYQFEDLVEKVAVRRDTSHNPLFDIMFILQNIYAEPARVISDDGEDTNNNTYTYDKKTSKFDLSLHAVERGEKLYFSFEYCTKLFREETILRFIDFFKKIISSVLKNPEKNIAEIDIISEEGKKKVLYEFNDTLTNYPREKTIHKLFEEQAEKTPDNIAVVGKAQRAERKTNNGEGHHAPCAMRCALTYRELNEKSNQLAYWLIEKGVMTDTIVGIMLPPCLEMIVSQLGILNAGGAFLPIDPDYPEERVIQMLKDSGTHFLLAQPGFTWENISHFDGQLIQLEQILSPEKKAANQNKNTACVENANRPKILAYVMYTSGSTGRAKGVLVEHRNVIRLVKETDYVELTAKTRILQTGAPVFDATTFEIWGPLLNGGQLVLVDNEVLLDAKQLGQALVQYKINTLWLTSPLFNQLTREDCHIFSCLNYLLVGGDVLVPEFINMVRNTSEKLKIINGYGPTENTTFSTTFSIDRHFEDAVPIGKPISNSTVYILNKYGRPQPIGIYGDLYVGGDGVSRGYLNNPELTEENFKRAVIRHSSFVISSSMHSCNHASMQYHSHSPHSTYSTIYRTGDLARWLPDGNIEFLGRIDNQVKIRGFRVEPGEIENQLLRHHDIEEAVVVVKEDASGDRYLCAYYLIGSKEQQLKRSQVDAAALREYLEQKLPHYMIPSFFVQLKKIPLTLNGKIDRKALPEPGIEIGEGYRTPENKTQEKMVEIWSQVLGIEKNIISIDANFFQLGGHSLKATVMTAKVHKELAVKIPLVEVFRTPFIKGLSGYIERKKTEMQQLQSTFSPIQPAQKKECYPLSSAQKGLYVQQSLLKGSTAYNVLRAVTIAGDFQTNKLEAGIKQLIWRHESFRTSFILVDDEPVQKINEKVEFKIEQLTAPANASLDKLAEPPPSITYTSIIENFIRPFDLSQAPLLRVGLIKIGEYHSLPHGENKYLLMIDMHHIITDGSSYNIFIKELTALYHGNGEELPPLRLQYKDYSVWKNSPQPIENLVKQKAYWLKVFEGEIPLLEMPYDFDRPPIKSFKGDALSFLVEEKLNGQLNRLAKETETTLYMVLLSAYYILLWKYTAQQDMVVGSPVTGRSHADLQDIIGMFVNMLALRNQPQGDKTFRELLLEVKERVIGAMENQDYHYEELVNALRLHRDPGRNPLFDVVCAMNSDISGKPASVHPNDSPSLILSGYEVESGVSRFDLLLGIQSIQDNGKGRISMELRYSTTLFKPSTVLKMKNHYIKILKQLVENRDIKLEDIDIPYGLLAANSSTFQEEHSEFEF